MGEESLWRPGWALGGLGSRDLLLGLRPLSREE